MFVFPPKTLIFLKQFDESDETVPVLDSVVGTLLATERLFA